MSLSSATYKLGCPSRPEVSFSEPQFTHLRRRDNFFHKNLTKRLTASMSQHMQESFADLSHSKDVISSAMFPLGILVTCLDALQVSLSPTHPHALTKDSPDVVVSGETLSVLGLSTSLYVLRGTLDKSREDPPSGFSSVT